MPCGGIFPIKDSFVEPYLKDYLCGTCNKNLATHYCEEWDNALCKDCIEPFLKSEEGLIMLQHGHEVILDY